MKLFYIYLVVVLFLASSCDDYLDVEPKGKVIPEKLDDFDLLLNGGSSSIHTTSDEKLIFMSADDFYSDESKLGEIDDPDNRLARAYRWDADLFPSKQPVLLWNMPYHNIYTLNFIINEVEGAVLSSANTENDIDRIRAEARVCRAYEYWLLVNSFAKQYDKATATNDLGVPLVIKADASGKTNGRASIQEVYDFILLDITESLEFLPENAVNKIRPSKASAYALLARIYLQMNDYKNARQNAAKAIEAKGELGDYLTNKYAEYKAAHANEQYMYRYYGYTRGYIDGYLTDELLDTYNATNDRRMFWKIGKKSIWKMNDDGTYFKDEHNNFVKLATYYENRKLVNISHYPSVPEMYIIRAECNARLNDGTLADVANDLNSLGKKRIKDYADFTSADFTNKEAALKYVLEERRREMVLSGMRWFDLKRLNKETMWAKTITHALQDKTYKLEPNSNKYVFPIPYDVINFNPDMKLNPRN